jgi:hypothetical protein
MKRVVMCAAVAGLACGASGQNISTDLRVSLSFDQSIYFIGESGTATIIADWTGVAGSYFSSFTVNILGNTDAFRIDSVAPIAWNNPALGFTGTPALVEGSRIYGLQAAQFSLIPPFQTANPILVTTISFTVVEAWTEFFFTAEVADGAPFPFSVTGPIFNDPVVEFGLDSFFSPVLRVPTPGSTALLAMAGLVGLRRRR